MQQQQTNNNVDSKKLTKKDIFFTWLRWICFTSWSTSSERLQALGVCAVLSPALEKLYTKKEDLSKALKRHLMFFNTQLNWGSIIGGATLALEEEKATGNDIPDEVITGFKTGLMGPMAGIGDTIDWLTLSPILVALFLPSAQNGSLIACIMPLILFTIPATICGYYVFHLGYRTGRSSITTLLKGKVIDKIINGMSILGLFMMGALSASFVKVTTPLKIVTETQTFEIQALIDTIAPGLLSLIVVVSVYLYLEKKGNKYLRVLVALLVIGIILGGFGII